MLTTNNESHGIDMIPCGEDEIFTDESDFDDWLPEDIADYGEYEEI